MGGSDFTAAVDRTHLAAWLAHNDFAALGFTSALPTDPELAAMLRRAALGCAAGNLSHFATLDRIEHAVERGPWLLGDHFSAADVMLGAMLQWLSAWGKLPQRPALDRYLASLNLRDGLKRAQAKEAEVSNRIA